MLNCKVAHENISEKQTATAPVVGKAGILELIHGLNVVTKVPDTI